MKEINPFNEMPFLMTASPESNRSYWETLWRKRNIAYMRELLGNPAEDIECEDDY